MSESYTLIDLEAKKVLDIQQVQVEYMDVIRALCEWHYYFVYNISIGIQKRESERQYLTLSRITEGNQGLCNIAYSTSIPNFNRV